MSFLKDTFTKTAAARTLGTGWDARSTGSTDGTHWALTGTQAQSRGTSSKAALAVGVTQQGNSSFARARFLGNVGASNGVGVNAAFLSTTTTNVAMSQYRVRTTGTDLAIIKGDTAGSATVLANMAYTRVADEELVITAEHSVVGGVAQVVLKAWAGAGTVDTTQAPLLTYTDTTAVLTGGRPSVGMSGTDNVYFDNFMGGDLADMPAALAAADSTISVGGTVDGQSVITTANAPTSDGVPTWRGLIHDLAGERLLPGELLHRRHFDFLGAPGTWTPPEGLTLTAGTATLTNPASGTGGLLLTTGTAIGDAAGVAFAYPLATTALRAVMIDLVGVSFTAASGFDLRVDLGDGGGSTSSPGGGYVESSAEARGYLYSLGIKNRTETDQKMIGEINRRRRLGVLLVTETQEVFLTVGDMIVGYRDAAATWSPGAIIPSVRIANTAAAAVSLQLCSMTVSMWA